MDKETKKVRVLKSAKDNTQVDLRDRDERLAQTAKDQKAVIEFVKKLTILVLASISLVYLCSVINVAYPIFKLSDQEKVVMVTAISINSLGFFAALIKGLFSIKEDKEDGKK
jgi:hypothetical protein